MPATVPTYLCASCLPDSEPRRLCVVVTDLTEERQHQRLVATQEALQASETRLLAASRLRDEFLATISHELRTPLNAILGWATLLKGGRLGPGKMAEAIEIIERNARAQVRLVDDLLDVSRVITGKLQLDVRPVPVMPLVQTVLESLRPTFEAKEITLETDWRQIDGGAVTNGQWRLSGRGTVSRATWSNAGDMVNGDPDRLQQVIWNLLSNAVKFTPPQRHGPRHARPRRHASRTARRRFRPRHQAGVPAARVRALPSGRQHDDAASQRTRTRAGHRASPRRTARRDRRGRE